MTHDWSAEAEKIVTTHGVKPMLPQDQEVIDAIVKALSAAYREGQLAMRDRAVEAVRCLLPIPSPLNCIVKSEAINAISALSPDEREAGGGEKV